MLRRGQSNAGELHGLLDACRRLKHALSERGEAAVTLALPPRPERSHSLARGSFDELLAPLLDVLCAEVRGLVEQSGGGWTGIEALHLVGGCARVPAVGDRLRREFSVPVSVGESPERAGCRGAALLAARLLAAPAERSARSPAFDCPRRNIWQL